MKHKGWSLDFLRTFCFNEALTKTEVNNTLNIGKEEVVWIE